MMFIKIKIPTNTRAAIKKAIFMTSEKVVGHGEIVSNMFDY